MKQVLLIFISTLFLYQIVSAQAIKGRVVDARNGEPIVGAYLLFLSLTDSLYNPSIRTRSDENGWFYEKINAGKNKVNVFVAGYDFYEGNFFTMTPDSDKTYYVLMKPATNPKFGLSLEARYLKEFNKLLEMSIEELRKLDFPEYVRTLVNSSEKVKLHKEDIKSKDHLFYTEMSWEIQLKTEAIKYNQAHSISEKAKILSELRSKLENEYESTNRLIEDDIWDMERKIKKLRKQLELRKENPDQIIEERLERLLAE